MSFIFVFFYVPQGQMSNNSEEFDRKAQEREYARHSFFEKNLSENPGGTQTPFIQLPSKLIIAIKVVAAVIVSFTIAFAVSCLLRYFPYTRSKFANIEKIYALAKKGKALIETCSQIKNSLTKQIDPLKNEKQMLPKNIPNYNFDDFTEGWEKKLLAQETFFTLLTTAIFSFLTPLMYWAINGFFERTASLNYHQILECYVAEWPDFKICTPKIFWERFDVLFLGYLVNNKKLIFNQEEAETMVKSMILESLEKKLDYKD